MQIKFELNRAGVGEILKSQAVVDVLRDTAQAHCPEGCVVSVYTNGRSRANASIGTATEEAYQDNLDNNTLLKAIGGG